MTAHDSNDVSILKNNGNGTFASWRSFDAGLRQSVAATVIDLERDGRLDLALAGPDLFSDDSWSVSILNNSGNDSFEVMSLLRVAITYSNRGKIVLLRDAFSPLHEDCNQDGLPDSCNRDEDANGIPDECEITKGPSYKRGDANANGVVDITDAIVILRFLFVGDVLIPCLAATDADDHDDMNIGDAVFLLTFLFLGGPEPPSPGPRECGPDPTSPFLFMFPPCIYPEVN